RQKREAEIHVRPAAPRIGSRVIDLQDVCGEEGIATAEYPQLVFDDRRTWHVSAGEEIGSLRPNVCRDVVVVQCAKVGTTAVASTGYVNVPVDNAKARSSHGDRHARAAGVPGVEHWVILPYLAEPNITDAISTYQVDLAVVVARTHKGSHGRHGRSGGPHTRGDVVDPGGIDHRGRIGPRPIEDQKLVDAARIHAGGHCVVQVGHDGE